jgi:hypothetical protein
MTVEGVMPNEVLRAIADMIELPQDSEFIKIDKAWVYPNSLRISEKYIEDEMEHGIDLVINKDDRSLIRLNFPDQLLLQERIKQRYGLNLRHGSSEEQQKAFKTKEAEWYRDSVLHKYYVYTGELERRGENARRITGVKMGRAEVPYEARKIIIDGDSGKEIQPKLVPMKEIEQLQFVSAEDLGKRVPKKVGLFESFEVIPTTKDITRKGNNYWSFTAFNEENYSAIMCKTHYLGKLSGLQFGSGDPMHRLDRIAVALWTDEKPKK